MKRFYKQVTIENLDTGFAISLDGRSVRSPAKSVVAVPTRTVAEAMQAEWAAVKETIQPENMPIHSLAVTVIDRVTMQRQALSDELASYLRDDVLRYRSADDVDLAARQTNRWNPWLDWAACDCGLVMDITAGLMPLSADADMEKKLTDHFIPLTDWQFGCLYLAATLSGSVILGLAFQKGRITARDIFETAFLDELYQNSLWGADEEAKDRQSAIEAEFMDIERFMNML
jgi:chaperone required for assembly of F1-ATPase